MYAPSTHIPTFGTDYDCNPGAAANAYLDAYYFSNPTIMQAKSDVAPVQVRRVSATTGAVTVHPQYLDYRSLQAELGGRASCGGGAMRHPASPAAAQGIITAPLRPEDVLGTAAQMEPRTAEVPWVTTAPRPTVRPDNMSLTPLSERDMMRSQNAARLNAIHAKYVARRVGHMAGGL